MGLFSKKSNTYEVAGKQFKCTVCEHNEFTQRTAQLNTATSSLLGLDWTDQEAECLVCENYGYVHWFLV